jgi:hydrogenase maturation factor
MNLLYARLIEIAEEDGIRLGKVVVGGAKKKVPLELLTEVECGDTVLICDGVAISKVNEDVSRDSRQTP